MKEEVTKNYTALLHAPQMCQGIMPNTVGESQIISFLKLSGNPVILLHQHCTSSQIEQHCENTNAVNL